MSNYVEKEKIELVKKILKRIHEGADIKELKRMFKGILAKVSPFEIPLIEQELIKEGIEISDILKLCDLHVELFRETLLSRELKGIPKGHPIDLLMKENEYLMKQAEVLSVYANALLQASDDERKRILKSILSVVKHLKEIKLHYRKIQMLIFPYLERRGIIAVPRVLWGREDQVIVKIRELMRLVSEGLTNPDKYYKVVAKKSLEVSKEISELIFRENKVLYPSVWVLLSEGEWAVISKLGKEIGYLVEVKEEWKTDAKPILPYEVKEAITPEQVEKLPKEFKLVASKALKPDTYQVKKEGDISLTTGFLNKDEIEGIFKALPLEITYADINNRIRFYTQSAFHKGFIRTKTIIGRKVEFCHPPRLEKLVMLQIEKIKRGEFDYKVFWTKIGDRIIRVIVSGVKDNEGKLIGTLEVVEDLTDVINNVEEIKKKIMVL